MNGDAGRDGMPRSKTSWWESLTQQFKPAESGMRIIYQAFSVPKVERNQEENEDAWFPSGADPISGYKLQLDCDVFRCALADGASDSCFSREWAELLADGYGEGLWSHDVSEAGLAQSQQQWQTYVNTLDLPWYAAEKVEMGAYAAIVGLTIKESDKTWDVVAIGDCCLFHIRKGKIAASHPITRSSQFTNLPYLLASIPGNNSEALERKSVKLSNSWKPGDIFLLMSDAMSAWLLKQRESRTEVRALRALCELQTADEFAQLVRTNRAKADREKRPALKDDDSTMIRVCVCA